jgi:UDP-N-acetylmuramoyl-tripeptide--D-alanyl-D-alanine ligase
MTAMMRLRQAQDLLAGSRLVGDGDTPIERVHSDTRTLQPGDLFVALRGERFDGHDYLAQARAGGAVAALAERGLAAAGLPGLEVGDSLVGLQRLSQAWRARFDLPLVAVTGSNGKTTVTQMIASILRPWQGEAALATRGNLNNHIGVPLTLLALRPAHRAAVVELGMNHPGEIAELAALVQPTVALVNNAQREHQEFMKSVEAVARENGAVLTALPADGTAVYPADDAHAPLWAALAGARRRITFGLGPGADVGAQARWSVRDAAPGWQLELHTPAGAAPVWLRVAGEHNVRNALAATACALAAGAPLAAVVQGLQDFEPVKGRSQVRTLRGGATLIDDTYNANPDSVRAAIDVLAGLPAPRWLVLGDMGEVGGEGPRFHAEVGAYARERGVDALWTAGAACAEAARAFGAAARHHERVEALVDAVVSAPPPFASVVVKGSRFMRMERVVEALQAAQGGARAA